MRRGLMEWNPQELPLEAIEARIARLRSAMRSAGLDAFVAYTNIARPSAVAHLTGFTPYWNEGLLLVPMGGRLVFATALSNRVADWIRATNPVSEVVSTPRPGALLGGRLAQDQSVKRVGVLELDSLPSELADHLAAAAPATQWVDAGAMFARIRCDIDTAERRLLARGDALAVAALQQSAAAAGSDAGALASRIEQHARLAGAEEVHIAAAPDLTRDTRLNRVAKHAALADRFAVRASVAYKGSWVRRIRTVASDDASARANAWFDSMASTLQPGQPLPGQLAAQLRSLPGATLKDWTAEGCIGSYPLEVIGSSRQPEREPLAAGRFLVLTVGLSLASGPWIGGAPLILGQGAL